MHQIMIGINFYSMPRIIGQQVQYLIDSNFNNQFLYYQMPRKPKQKELKQQPLQDQECMKGFVDNYFYVKQILKEKQLKNGRVKLFVSWEGWPESCNSWVYKETVTPVQQFLKSVESGQYESMQSRTSSRKSRKKEEAQQNKYVDQNMTKSKGIKQQKVLMPEKQVRKRKDANLCSNCKNSMAQTSLQGHSFPLEQSSKFQEESPHESLQFSRKMQLRQPVHQKKKSKLSIKALKKLKKMEIPEKIEDTTQNATTQKQPENSDHFMISLEQLTDSGEISKISGSNSIGTFFMDPFHQRKALQEADIQKKQQEVICQSFQVKQKVVPLFALQLQEKIENLNEKNQTQNQSLLLQNTYLNTSANDHQEQVTTQPASNLLEYLDISTFNKNKFQDKINRSDDTSLLICSQGLLKQYQDSLKNKKRQNQNELDSSFVLLSSSFYDESQKNLFQSAKKIHQDKIGIKNEQLASEQSHTLHEQNSNENGIENSRGARKYYQQSSCGMYTAEQQIKRFDYERDQDEQLVKVQQSQPSEDSLPMKSSRFLRWSGINSDERMSQQNTNTVLSWRPVLKIKHEDQHEDSSTRARFRNQESKKQKPKSRVSAKFI